MDAKQDKSDLPYHLPVSFSVCTGGYRESVLSIGILKKKPISVLHPSAQAVLEVQSGSSFSLIW